MILTILFYLSICFFCTVKGLPRKRRILWGCIATALYTGLRWNYTPDYPAYERLFNQFTSPDFEYDGKIVHVEYGWYLLNKYSAFLGYWGFVFVSSCLFCFGLYKLMELFTPKRYVWLVLLGVVTAGGFTTLLSAQRQMFVASIFMIGFRYLLFDKIHGWRDLYSRDTIVYFVLIWLASYLHKSALFLEIIPFVLLVPKRSKLVPPLLISAIVMIAVLGNTVLVNLFETYSSEFEMYDNLKYNGDWNGSLSVIQAAMWVFMFYYTMKVYLKCDVSRSENASLLIAMIAIVITFSGYYLGQVVRVAHYLFMFTYLNIGIITRHLERQGISSRLYVVGMAVWVIWNALKIFSINVGTFQEYKTIFSAL